jgi:hypothetical protein
MQGTLAGTDQWFTTYAAEAEASAHFGISKTGEVIQWVDTDNQSWNCAAGNPWTIGVEHEGYSGETLTAQQITADRKLAEWCKTVHGIPLTPTDSVEGYGTGWHGMGGEAWGGHTDCPGAPIVSQRGLIDVPATTGPKTWKATGSKALVALAVGQHMMASTILRFTIQAGQYLTPKLAAYIDAGDLAHAPVPAGETLYLTPPEAVKTVEGTGGADWSADGKASLAGLCAEHHVAVSTTLRETIARKGEFAPALAHYLCAGDLKNTLLPAGTRMWLPPAQN